ncbi:UNVERIFIED_CONTAM: hypothetical protein Sradi_5680300 [Sesamum radiatum]|uniref:Retrotransposon Copia-like N-terminal domain-containing protein n=1 Tax=Sesamum radiatum TaxID=300843 RepID=A0AAW2L0N5_SESRA
MSIALISQQAVSEHVEMSISGAKFEIVKFDGIRNFGLWQARVKDLLVQQGILKALRPQNRLQWIMKIGKNSSSARQEPYVCVWQMRS